MKAPPPAPLSVDSDVESEFAAADAPSSSFDPDDWDDPDDSDVESTVPWEWIPPTHAAPPTLAAPPRPAPVPGPVVHLPANLIGNIVIDQSVHHVHVAGDLHQSFHRL